MNLQIKICGLTCATDAAAALEAGADWLGFVLYAGSPRAVSPVTLRGILQELGEAAEGKAVGVFVNALPAQVRDTALQCGLAAVQMHGDEAASDVLDMPVPVWRSVQVHGGGWRPQPSAWPASRYVVDAAVAGQYGGTGTTADWTCAAALARQVPVMLAGGLCPENVADAVRRVRPLGVDVSSGVEIRPGVKSHPALRAFITVARQSSAGLPLPFPVLSGTDLCCKKSDSF
jgi:phosphoribosylanthranilate isomerase